MQRIGATMGSGFSPNRVRCVRQGFATAFCLAVALLSSGSSIRAQQLSIRRYGVSDGLAHSGVRSIYQDVKGYLWFGTNEGVSRFDGYRFTNYSTREGLVNPYINAVTEDREGHIWVGTNGGGVSRFIDGPQRSLRLERGDRASVAVQTFVSYPVGNTLESNRVNSLLFDAEGYLWCATDVGLYRAAPASNGEVKFEIVAPHELAAERMASLADSKGRLWFGIDKDLMEVVAGHVIKYGPADEVGRLPIRAIIEDPQGRLIVANQKELFELSAPNESGRGQWKRIPMAINLKYWIAPMIADSTGCLWIGTHQGLIKYKDGKESVYTTAQGLTQDDILALYEDRDGNLWIGTAGAGVCKLSVDTLVSFTTTEGLPAQDVDGIIEDRKGRVFIFTDAGKLAEISEDKAVPIEAAQPAQIEALDHRILQDNRGDWWIGTNQALFRFQGPELQLRWGKKLTLSDGIPEAPVWLIGKDQAGKVWAVMDGPRLFWLDPARPGHPVFEPGPLIGAWPSKRLIRMMIDRSGLLWMSEYHTLARVKNGIVELLRPTDGLPETDPRAFFQDSRGWLWIGQRYRGVSVTKDPSADAPTFVNYSTENGLTSDTVWTITEDDFGRMYFGTGKGLDRLDISTGRIRHFTTADGLAGDQINDCIKDSRGNIWIATLTGLSRLNPRAERVISRAPPIYLSRISAEGEDLDMAATGATLMRGVELLPSRNNLLIEYVGLDFYGERELKYQYKLEGADPDWWTEPTDQRSVNYARLAPGSYRFLVRAINQAGIVSLEPAVFEFRILRPVWQRWWFQSLVALLVGLTAYSFYRYRVARLIELERVRTRIASDLHDDIGSGLSRMAILSEVVKQQIGSSSEASLPMLSEIADSARGLVDSMGDIVWAIDPRRDHLSNVVSRVGRFATSILEAKGIKLDFKAPSDFERVKLDPEQRRHILLIFKEAINNVARHADCTRASVSFTVAHNQLVGEIRDDGRGFQWSSEQPATNGSEGHGMESMQRRAVQLGGNLTIHSTPGEGTSLKLTVPLKRPIA